MNNKSSTLSTQAILQHLHAKGYAVNHDNLPALGEHAATVAWYQHILLAIGVFATFVCFLLLLRYGQRVLLSLPWQCIVTLSVYNRIALHCRQSLSRK
ncbi:MAG: hypothetical protein CR963_01190 [Gammaproteobacteria bacterium]|nr:MAG: hypothetical protein CR963_01190 [Gammaproteobacteria bacterium]